jgi:hypothetical protein
MEVLTYPPTKSAPVRRFADVRDIGSPTPPLLWLVKEDYVDADQGRQSAQNLSLRSVIECDPWGEATT